MYWPRLGGKGQEFQRITEGWDNLIWRFEGEDGTAHGLRMARPRAENTFAKWRFESEAATIRALKGSRLPLPWVEHLGEFEGAPFMIQRWLPGETMLKRLGQRPWSVARFGEYMGRLQARLHTVATEGVPVIREEEWARGVEEFAPGLVERAKAEAVFDAVCHLDLHPGNILMNNGRISGLVDLTNTRVADRRMDLAQTDAILTMAPLKPEPLRPLYRLIRGRFTAAWRRGYVRDAGSWPLTPVFRALGAVHHFSDIRDAVRDRRGWATEQELEGARELLDQRLADAGMAPSLR